MFALVASPLILAGASPMVASVAGAPTNFPAAVHVEDFPTRAEARAFVFKQDWLAAEWLILNDEGSLGVYRGGRNGATLPHGNIYSHTHGDKLALPSPPDVDSMVLHYRRDPEFIFSRPPNAMEVSLMRLTAFDGVDVWHMRSEAGQRKPQVRHFRIAAVPPTMRLGVWFFVTEYSATGVASQIYTHGVEDWEDPMDFWAHVLSHPSPGMDSESP